MNLHHTETSPDETRARIGEILNHALADEFALSSAARDYHWNVTGPHFRSLNEIFDEQYHQIDGWIEKLGARARVIGVAAHTGWAELIKAPRFTPAQGVGLNTRRMLSELIELHEGMAKQLRRDVETCASMTGDAVTGELLGQLTEYHETAAWMLGELLEDRELAQA